jgi:hypothetical protein
MRWSKFRELMNEEFGEQYASVLFRDLVLRDLSDRTAEACIAQGEDPKDVWLAICKAENVPADRWHVTNKNTKKRHAD